VAPKSYFFLNYPNILGMCNFDLVYVEHKLWLFVKGKLCLFIKDTYYFNSCNLSSLVKYAMWIYIHLYSHNSDPMYYILSLYIKKCMHTLYALLCHIIINRQTSWPLLDKLYCFSDYGHCISVAYLYHAVCRYVIVWMIYMIYECVSDMLRRGCSCN